MGKYILSIDQGTTGTTSLLIGTDGHLVAKENQEFPQIYAKPGWVEHNLNDIWKSTINTIQAVLSKAKVQSGEIIAIGITNQRETIGIWDRTTSEPLANAIVWQCRRTTKRCQQLKKQGHASRIFKKTGLVLDPYFSASKLQWLLSEVSGAKAKAKNGQLVAGTIDSYLVHRLTGGSSFKTDPSNASRTMLFNINKMQWDKDLLKLFSVDENILPEVVPSNGEFGVTQSVPGLPDGIPIRGIAGDQQAALFGQLCFKPGEAKCTFGTGSFILMNTGHQRVTSKNKLLTTIAWQLQNDKKPTYALEGGAFICGAAVQWLRDELQIIDKSSAIEALAREVEDSGGVQLVPAFAGLGAPYWNPEARGIITGLTRGSGRAHLARATLEAMALQNVDILLAMEKDAQKKLKVLKVDGGASENSLLMQLQADYLGRKISRPKLVETTAIGAAFLAGLGIGVWSDQKSLHNVWQSDQEFMAQMTSSEQKKRLQHWHHAIRQCQAH